MEYKVVVKRRQTETDELSHGLFERKDHKYVARVETGKLLPKYRYFYDIKEYNQYLKEEQPKIPLKKKSQEKDNGNLFDKLGKKIDTAKKDAIDDTKKAIGTMVKNTAKSIDKTVDKVSKELPKAANKVVDKAKEVATKLYDDKDNIYDVNPTNYKKKIEKVKESPEWKAIVASGDPEYVKKNSDGTTSYLVDDYLMKKKRPLLDVIDDIANNRQITVNKLDKDAIVAGVKQQIIGKITTGMMAIGVAAKALTEMGKVSQGSYNDEIKELYNKVDAGRKAAETIMDSSYKVSDKDIEKMTKMVENTRQVSEIERVAKKISEDDIVTSAKVIMESELVPENVKSNEYYQLAESTLTNLSEEEIIMLNLMLERVRRGK